MFLDSHCHLTAPQLAPDFLRVLERARINNVTSFINIGDDIDSSIVAQEQCVIAQGKDLSMWCTAGVHPQNAAHYKFEGEASTGQKLYALAAHPSVCAIGEIGLDYIYDETHPQYPGATRQVQETVLCEQLEIAIAIRLPVVIHNRAADERLLTIMEQYASRLQGGVFHCFGSSIEIAHRVLDLGLHLGFTGLVTFKNAEEVRLVAKDCPLDRLLIETDSPFLAPVPFRGKTNEPSYLPHVAESIADLHGTDIQRIAEITTDNAMRLFQLNGEKSKQSP